MIAKRTLSLSIAATYVYAYLGVFCLLALLGRPLQAEEGDEPDRCSSEEQLGCVPIGKWQISLGLGIGMRDNPLVNGEETPLFIIPNVRYYGERFFFDTYIGGATLFETDRSMINAIATISFDQIYFRTSNIGNFALESGPFAYEANNADQQSVQSNGSDRAAVVGADFLAEDGSAYDRIDDQVLQPDEIIVADNLHSRDTTLFGGFELAYFIGGWDISWQILRDISNLHDGFESRLSTSRFFMYRRNKFSFSTGVTWQDDKTMNYYWGVGNAEVANPDLAYFPNSGYSPFVRIDWRRKLFKNWSLQTTLHHKWLSNEISQSPLVEENTVLTLFIGGVYHF